MAHAGLLYACHALEALAAGKEPDRTSALCGALALDTLTLKGEADRDIGDAAIGLNIIVTGGVLDLDASGRARARQLATAVRRRAS